HDACRASRTGLMTMSRTVQFSQDELGYLTWLDAHPDGFVVNLRQGLSSGYAVLHRASCGRISNARSAHGGYTERGYRKMCAASVEGLRDELRAIGIGDFTRRCSFCKPDELGSA